MDVWGFLLFGVVGPLVIGIGVVAARRYGPETDPARKRIALCLVIVGTLVAMVYVLIVVANLLILAGYPA